MYIAHAVALTLFIARVVSGQTVAVPDGTFEFDKPEVGVSGSTPFLSCKVKNATDKYWKYITFRFTAFGNKSERWAYTTNLIDVSPADVQAFRRFPGSVPEFAAVRWQIEYVEGKAQSLQQKREAASATYEADFRRMFPVEIEYVVSGTAGAVVVTYTNNEGGIEQLRVTSPWSKKFRVQRGYIFSLSAQSQEDSGSVAIKVFANGIQRKTSISEGPYVVAACAGEVP